MSTVYYDFTISATTIASNITVKTTDSLLSFIHTVLRDNGQLTLKRVTTDDGDKVSGNELNSSVTGHIGKHFNIQLSDGRTARLYLRPN